MEERQKVAFIVNSATGLPRRIDLSALIDRSMDGAGFDHRILCTDHPGHAEELAAKAVAEGCRFVVAVGGDGTVNEVGRALLGTDAVLGIVPAGSGNGLARHLGIPLDPEKAVRTFCSGRTVRIDYGIANGLVFFCTCGMGFDARVGYAYARGRDRGFLPYLKNIVAEFFRYRPRRYEFIAAGRVFRRRAFIVSFANAGQYGYDAYISPKADIQDGLIDVFILKPFPFHRIAELVMRLLNRNMDRSSFVQILRVPEVTVRRRRRNIFQFDGESCRMGKSVTVAARRRGLKVVVPAESPLQD